MTTPCSEIQNKIMAHGPMAFRSDASARDHLVECAVCFAFLEAHEQLIGELADQQPIDPDDKLVEKTLARVAKDHGVLPDDMTQPHDVASSPGSGQPGSGQPGSGQGEESRPNGKSPRLFPLNWVKAAFGWVGKEGSSRVHQPRSWKRFSVLSSSVVVITALFLMVLFIPQYRRVAPDPQKYPVSKEVGGIDTDGANNSQYEAITGRRGGLEGGELEKDQIDLNAALESRKDERGRSQSSPARSPERQDHPAKPALKSVDEGQRLPETPAEVLTDEELPVSALGEKTDRSESWDALYRWEKSGTPGLPEDKTKQKHSKKENLSHLEPKPIISDNKVFNTEYGLSKTREISPRRSQTAGFVGELEEEIGFFERSYEKPKTSNEFDGFSVDGRDAGSVAVGSGKTGDDASVLMPSRQEFGLPTAPPPAGDTIARVGQVGTEFPVITRKTMPKYPEKAAKIKIQGYVLLDACFRKDGLIDDVKVLRGLGKGKFGFEDTAIRALNQWKFLPAQVNEKPADMRMTIKMEFGDSGVVDIQVQPSSGKASSPSAGRTNTPARDFLDQYAKMTDLNFQDQNGYWANTYVPGDPMMRVLQSRLASYDRSSLNAAVGRELQLEHSALRLSQPFDAPTNAAMTAFIHADRAGITDPSRMVVQVGLQATHRLSGQRPAMNLGIVFDLEKEPTQEQVALYEALLTQFQESRDLADRFSLVVAGPRGGLILKSDQFRHGPITVAKQRLFGNGRQDSGNGMDLPGAMRLASKMVQGTEDSNAPLGSSAVILVTFRPLPGQVASDLERLAIKNITLGIPLSVIGLGNEIDLTQLNGLTLAGQGNRRLLNTPQEAKALVDREMTAVAGVIARAVRLRIRLAPGVQLLEVLGSHKLGEIRAEKVRQAEKSVDRLLSARMGIASDRGEDEEGIQIVIPAFNAGDAHVFLLDVVVNEPGPVADVTIRYKDLVFLRNGVTRANLSLPRGDLSLGPLERNVIKNLVAFNVAETLVQTSQAISQANHANARSILEQMIAVVQTLPFEVPGLLDDADLAQDALMLEEYLWALNAQKNQGWQHPNLLADSLKYAAWLKLLPQPEEIP